MGRVGNHLWLDAVHDFMHGKSLAPQFALLTLLTRWTCCHENTQRKKLCEVPSVCNYSNTGNNLKSKCKVKRPEVLHFDTRNGCTFLSAIFSFIKNLKMDTESESSVKISNIPLEVN